MIKAVFLDRDGTLNEDTLYPHKIKDFKLLPGVIQGLRKLSNEFIFVIITNQSGIGRGYYEEKDFKNFNNHLLKTFVERGIHIKKTYCCPHTPEDMCDCRKPNTRYIEQAVEEFQIDLKGSWVIGDHPHDIEMGLKAGIQTVYLLTGHGKKHLDGLEKNSIKPDFIAENFLQAANFIIKKIKRIEYKRKKCSK